MRGHRMVANGVPLDITNDPELARLAEQVHETGVPYMLVRDGEPLAVIYPLSGKGAPRKPRRRRTGILRPDDALFELIGFAASGGPGDVSSNKHKYLADAYAAEAE